MESNNSESSETVNRDEMIMQQQRQIEKEISDSIPLISGLNSINSLNTEYEDDVIYSSKVKDLALKYHSIRRTRPDGNCFFRAFAYAYLEYLLTNKNDYEKFKEIAEKSHDKLVKLGFPQFTIEDFHDNFMEVVQRIAPGENNVEEELHKLLNVQGCSDYVVVYLRLITSGQIQEGADFYQNFIEGGTIEEFRHLEVEPMYKESDHIHIIALCSALNVGARVEYMDRGEGGHVKAHDFPDGMDPKVFLLYRPGHYDILYPN